MFTGKHLIAGSWLAGETTYASSPADGPAHAFAVGTAADVDRAAIAAEAAFPSFANTSRAQRAAFLDRIAVEIEARADAITEIGCQETGLPAARLTGERGRTVGHGHHTRSNCYQVERHKIDKVLDTHTVSEI